MKKIHIFLLTLGCATLTHNSFTMMQKIRTVLKPYTTNKPTVDTSKILITKKSKEKIQMIGQDYDAICDLITNKSKELIFYEKPSDLINSLSQNNSISTKYMSPGIVFLQEDINFLDQQFKKVSTQHGSNYAWGNIIFLMHTNLENRFNDIRDHVFMHSAARVSLRQKQRLPKLFNLFNSSSDYDDTIAFNIESWATSEKDKMIKNIQHHKNILSKE